MGKDVAKSGGRTKFVLSPPDTPSQRAWLTAIACGASAANAQHDIGRA